MAWNEVRLHSTVRLDEIKFIVTNAPGSSWRSGNVAPAQIEGEAHEESPMRRAGEVLGNLKGGCRTNCCCRR
jgi:hypothetical protein